MNSDSTTIAAQASEIRSWLVESSNRYPRPDVLPLDHSANTAPMAAMANAILAPVKTPGSAAGSAQYYKGGLSPQRSQATAIVIEIPCTVAGSAVKVVVSVRPLQYWV